MKRSHLIPYPSTWTFLARRSLDSIASGDQKPVRSSKHIKTPGDYRLPPSYRNEARVFTHYGMACPNYYKRSSKGTRVVGTRLSTRARAPKTNNPVILLPYTQDSFVNFHL